MGGTCHPSIESRVGDRWRFSSEGAWSIHVVIAWVLCSRYGRNEALHWGCTQPQPSPLGTLAVRSPPHQGQALTGASELPGHPPGQTAWSRVAGALG